MGLSVGLGAFGAHALEKLLEARGRANTWDLAVHYQMIHGLSLLIIGLLSDKKIKWFDFSSLALTAGVLCFSGSLYMICLTEIVFPLVLITPLGGGLLIVGWACLFIAVLKKYKSNEPS
ncbi:MAG: DUF423 domain-containing protein [Bacteroidetes bacterium]|nr:DUF423 domain-containing protein [Bacteroidota bacterium]